MTTAQRAPWWWLAAAIGIAIIALSVHVVMLQVLHVPYPDMRGVGTFGLVLLAGRILALFVLCRLAAPWLGTRPVALQLGVVALLDLAIAGDVRASVMQAVVTGSFVHPALTLVVAVAESVLLAVIALTLTHLLRGPLRLVLAALATTALQAFVIGPATAAIAQPFAHFQQPSLHVQPYGAYVLAWSYASFLETVAAVLVIARLASPRLSARRGLAFVQFALLVLLLRGTLVMQLLFPLRMQGGVAPAALSTSQFFLQDLVMVVLAWWAWTYRTRRNGAIVSPP
ncbi:MAG: hypothetical protein ABW163_02710 [Luteimonas sp.]